MSWDVGDTIAGERERHTPETLLASRISDRAILLGKLIAIVGYAWGIVLVSLLIGVVSANLAQRLGRWIFYAPFGLLLEALALSLLTSVLAASVGVLISLRAATSRQAQQTMGVSTLVLFAALLLASRAVPAQVLLSYSSNASRFWLILWQCALPWMRWRWEVHSSVFNARA
jgi:ABC-2 type transport system permease protein